MRGRAEMKVLGDTKLTYECIVLLIDSYIHLSPLIWDVPGWN